MIKNKKTYSIPLPFLIFLIFLILKLTNNIDWSWLWVTSPIWIPIASIVLISIVLIYVVSIALLIGVDFDKIKSTLQDRNKK